MNNRSLSLAMLSSFLSSGPHESFLTEYIHKSNIISLILIQRLAKAISAADNMVEEAGVSTARLYTNL